MVEADNLEAVILVLVLTSCKFNCLLGKVEIWNSLRVSKICNCIQFEYFVVKKSEKKEL